jgi:carotenoid cleavage dioxygenase
MTDKLATLENLVKTLQHQVGVLEDIHAIRRLQHAYGYYIDKCLYDETVDLFAESGEVWFMGGKFKGKAGLRRLYCNRFRERFTGGINGPVKGFLLEHLQLQDIIDVAPDGRTAHARARSFMQAGRHADHANSDREGWLPRQWWEGGIYENTYAREDGVWKIQILNYRPVWHADFDSGWSQTKPQYVPFFSKTFPDDPNGPDALITDPKPVLWPDTDVVPFHYPHPVTGKMWKP